MIETDALIVGAGPIGLFQVFQLGLLGIHCHVIEALPHPGGQCAELYADKPIYDIPGIPATSGAELVASLMAQIEPFTRNESVAFHWGQLVSSLRQQSDGRFQVETQAGTAFLTKTIFIAAGAGAFMPRTLRVEGLEQFEGTQVFHGDAPDLDLTGKHLVIQGDDDRALEWAIHAATPSAAMPKSITLIHRREVFTARRELAESLTALRQAGRVNFVACQITELVAPPTDSPTNSKNTPLLTGLRVMLQDGSVESIPVDALLLSLGMSPKLGPIAEWGLDMQRKQLPVDTEKYQTTQAGIFAVGDINTYPGKKKLILCGFHECVLAAFGAAEIIFPGKPQLLQYTTTSTRLHALLGRSR